MKYRKVGRSNLEVSEVGLGCNNFVHRNDLEQTRRLIHAAIDMGITLFDTADVYGNRGGSEEFLGQILGPRRKDIVLATKFGQQMDDAGKLQGASRAYIVTAAEASLRRLRTDYIDLYQQHKPKSEPIEETLRALDDLVRAGKVRYVGASNFDGALIREAHKVASQHGLSPFISFQSEYSLLARAVEGDETLTATEACGAGFLPYYPLASGLLSGKYKQGTVPEGTRLASPRQPEQRFIANANWPVIEQLSAFCEARGHTLLELAFSWLLSRPVVSSVIAGATSPEQLRANVAASGWALSAADMAEIDRITGGGR